jgi:hypothetical protein
MTLDADGDLGIGTTNPTARVHAYSTASAITAKFDSNQSGGATIGFYGSGTANGFVGTSGSWLGTSATDMAIIAETSKAVTFFTGGSGTERARIDSSGNFLVSTTSTAPRDFTTGSGGTKIPVAGGALEHATTSANCMFINQIGSGAITSLIDFRQNASSIGSISYNGTLVVYNTTSDYRLKTVVGAVTGHSARIDALEPIEYTWNSNGSRTRGFLAHKFQEVYADSVTGAKDAVDADGKPIYQAMQASSSEVIADLVAEIQSLRKRLADAGI